MSARLGGTAWGMITLVALVACEEPALPPGHVYSVQEAVAVCKKQLGGDFDSPTYEVVVPEEVEALGIQAFHTPGSGWRPAFLLHQGSAVWIGAPESEGHISHVTSVVMHDLEQDGRPEVLVAYSHTSGKWNQSVWSYEVASGQTNGLYLGPWLQHPYQARLVTTADGVEVQSVAGFDDETWTFKPDVAGERVGRLEFQSVGGSTRLDLVE